MCCLTLVTPADLRWVRDVLMVEYKLQRVTIAEDLEAKGRYPDVWAEPGTQTITVTREWARQGVHERRKRLVHEMGHLIGMEHNPSIGYYSHPEKDTYSWREYERIEQKYRNRGSR